MTIPHERDPRKGATRGRRANPFVRRPRVALASGALGKRVETTVARGGRASVSARMGDFEMYV
eukprot:29579-Pelagococcus_subviridis.AAC.9